jgi:uncharacterized membrane protein YbhN (UPF0104 family)
MAENTERTEAPPGPASRAARQRRPRDLLGTFRALAPPRAPIVLQRWSPRRVGLALAVPVAVVAAVWVAGSAFRPAQNIGAYPPLCDTGHATILAAQAVPSAALVPCVSELSSGWRIGGADVASGQSVFWLDSDQAGPRLTLLFGGSALVTLAYIGGLVASVKAFGVSASIVQVGAVYLVSSLIAAASPTPGGIGAIEAALAAGLTGIGIPNGPAVSAVLLYRLATYWLPVPPGWYSWRLLQRMEYV